MPILNPMMMGSAFRQDRGLRPSCPQETSGVVRAADVPYWLEHVKNTPLSTHIAHATLAHTLTAFSHVQVGANLGSRAADLKTITWDLFSTGGVNTWLSEWYYGWAPIVWLLGLIHCYGRLSRGPKWFALAAAPFASFPLTLGELWSPKYESVVHHSTVSGHWVLCFGNCQSCCWDTFSCCLKSIVSFCYFLHERKVVF